MRQKLVPYLIDQLDAARVDAEFLEAAQGREECELDTFVLWFELFDSYLLEFYPEVQPERKRRKSRIGIILRDSRNSDGSSNDSFRDRDSGLGYETPSNYKATWSAFQPRRIGTRSSTSFARPHDSYVSSRDTALSRASIFSSRMSEVPSAITKRASIALDLLIPRKIDAPPRFAGTIPRLKNVDKDEAQNLETMQEKLYRNSYEA